MILKDIVKHITSSGFWRLVALLGKRLLSIDKIFSKLSPLLLLLLYILHFIRAGLRVVDYFRKTRNKNLGETRKLFFSAFKMTIENKSKPFSYSQSFFKHTSDSKDFSDACSAAIRIKQQLMMGVVSVHL